MEQRNREVSHIEQGVSHSKTLPNAIFKRVFLFGAAIVMLGALPQPNYAAPVSPAVDPAACTRVGAIWWNELLAPETDKLTDFYSKVVGWTPKVVDAEDQTQPARSPADRYTIFMDGDQEVAGLMRANHPDAVHSGVGWFTYVQVADVEKAVANAQANGGTVLRSPLATSEGHLIAVVSDPMGIVFGLITPKGCWTE